jgi:hypothetical protein
MASTATMNALNLNAMVLLLPVVLEQLPAKGSSMYCKHAERRSTSMEAIWSSAKDMNHKHQESMETALQTSLHFMVQGCSTPAR